MPEPEHWLPEHWELGKTTTDYQAARSQANSNSQNFNTAECGVWSVECGVWSTREQVIAGVGTGLFRRAGTEGMQTAEKHANRRVGKAVD